MPISVDVRCTRCDGDRSALRLTVAETVWYLLDVTDEGIHPVQPEAEDEPTLQLVCLACGYQGALRPEVRALLRLE
jgi:hypothetical protein